MITTQDRQDIIQLISQYSGAASLLKKDRGRVRANLISELWVGGGNTSWRINREGQFQGADNYTDATYKVNYAGVLTCSGANVSGTINATGGNISGDMAVTGALNVTGSVTAGTADTHRAVLSGSGELDFYEGSDKVGYIKGFDDSSHGGSVELQADNYLHLKASEWLQCNYNAGGGSGEFLIYNDDTLVFQLNDSNNCLIGGALSCGAVTSSGDVKCGGTFKSSDGSSGYNGNYGVINGIRWDGDTLQRRWATLKIKDGLITDIDQSSYEDV